MKIIKIFFHLLLMSFLIVACSSKKDSITNTTELNNISKETLIELESFLGKPDNVLTTTELETKRKLADFLDKHLKVVDNHFVLDAEPHDFEKAGLSKHYYNLLKLRFVELNHVVDSLGVENIAEKYKEGSLEFGMTLKSSEEDK